MTNAETSSSDHLDHNAFPVAVPPAMAETSEQTLSNSNVNVASPSPDCRKVLHLINGEHYSGAERVQDLLAACLPEFGYQVGFGCLKLGSFGKMRKFQSAPLYDASMRSRTDLRSIGSLSTIVRTEGYELIHAHTPRSAMIAKLVSVNTNIPLVYHVHSPAAHDSTRVWQNRLNAWIEKLSLVSVAKIITVSESLRTSTIADGYRQKLVQVIPNGVPICSDVADRPTPSGTWTLGTIALFRPRKGTEVLLRAISKLVADGLDVRLRAVGSFETEGYSQSLLQLTRDLNLEDRIDWVGFQTDVNAQLQAMDLFVLPSLFGEGLPMVVLEAMAAGVPVIGTKVEGVPEASRHEVDGLIAEPNDPSSLADAIRQIVTGQANWQTLRENAVRRQRAYFSDRSMAQGVAAVYDHILSKRAAASTADGLPQVQFAATS
ncbi:MAG: glycosyltransferase [Pirellulaceae bacterium]